MGGPALRKIYSEINISFLQHLVPNSVDRTIWRTLWGMKMHKRLKMLLWKIAQNILPTRSRLHEIGHTLDARCP